MSRSALLVPLLVLVACRQPTAGEVGEQAIRDAHPLAVIKASERASDSNPGYVPASAKGLPVQQAPMK